nr:MAG TPA: hypothetical protein [Inoviridae sp.]
MLSKFLLACQPIIFEMGSAGCFFMQKTWAHAAIRKPCGGKSSLHPAAALRYNLHFSALRAGCFSCV